MESSNGRSLLMVSRENNIKQQGMSLLTFWINGNFRMIINL